MNSQPQFGGRSFPSPPALPAPPRDPPPGRAQVVRIGETLVTQHPGSNDAFLITEELGRTHSGRILLAQRIVEGMYAAELVIIKEFRSDDRKYARLGSERRALRAFIRDVRHEDDVCFLLEYRLRRRVGYSAATQPPWRDKLAHLLLVDEKITMLASTQPRVEVAYLISRFIDESMDLEIFNRMVLVPMWRAGEVGRYRMLVTSIARGLAMALGDMHSAGVVHRDIKPSNVVVRWNAATDPKTVAVYLIDFGHACAFVDPLTPLTLDPPTVEGRRYIQCQVPFNSTPYFIDPDVLIADRDMEDEEMFTFLRRADAYSFAFTIFTLFLPGMPADYPPVRAGEIQIGTSAMPLGMITLLQRLTAQPRELRMSVIESVPHIERIADHIDPTRREAPNQTISVISYESVTSSPPTAETATSDDEDEEEERVSNDDADE